MPTQVQAGGKAGLWWLLAPVSAGFMLHSHELFMASPAGSKGFAIGLLAWSALPFAVALAIWRLGVRATCAAGYAWASLLGSLYMHYAVFIQPTGSTAALGLLFMPLWNLIVLGPVGLLVVWGLQASASGTGKNSA